MPLDSSEVQRVIKHAWNYGHFRNPKYPETHNVQKNEVELLTLSDPAAKQAIASMQDSDAQLNTLCQQHHMRHLAWVDESGIPFDEPDGDPGPATLALTDIPRCGMPDFGGEFGEAGVGGWLDCDPESDADHSVRIWFDDRNAPSTWQGYLDKVKQNAVDISADIGLDVRYVESGDYESSVLFKHIPGGVIGYYYLPGRG